VTRFTQRNCVQANEWKPGETVIEKDIGRPFRLLVTASAIFTQPTLMDITHTMTTETNEVWRQVQGATAMTNPAIQFRMCTNQWKIRVRLVIERGV
jgi:hypothetical protein